MMTLEVFPTDGEAFEAAAALVVERLRAADGPASVALAGGRVGRGVMVALAGRADLPWERIHWFWGDERCVPPGDPRSNVRLARESLLAPRVVPAERIHPPPLELEAPERIATAYAAAVAELPFFDLLLLGVGTNGHIASLMPGCAALGSSAPVAAVPVAEVSEEPIVARVTITPSAIAAARHVLVTVTGDAKATIVRRALRPSEKEPAIPAQLVPPSERVTWIVDRAAAAELLRDARPAPPGVGRV